MKRQRKIKSIIVLAVLVVIAIIFASLLYTGFFNKEENNIEVIDTNTEVVLDDNTDPNRELWLNNKAINEDYLGEIIFDSGLINKSFVQATDVYDKSGNLYHFYTVDGNLVTDASNYNGNDVYIYTNWIDMSYDYNILGGSVFMDYRNELSDQNIIIYGHHFSNPKNDPNREKAFTPLEKLLEEENFKDNNIVKLVLDNETRTYQLAYVYVFDTANEFMMNNMQYYRTSYNYDEFLDVVDNDYFQNYIEAMEDYKLYDTGLKLETSDKTLTLQTCMAGTNGERLQICVFKQIDIKYFEG